MMVSGWLCLLDEHVVQRIEEMKVIDSFSHFLTSDQESVQLNLKLHVNHPSLMIV